MKLLIFITILSIPLAATLVMKAQVVQVEAQPEGPCHWIYVKALESAKLADVNNTAAGWGRTPLSEFLNTQAEMSVMWSQLHAACSADARGVTR